MYREDCGRSLLFFFVHCPGSSLMCVSFQCCVNKLNCHVSSQSKNHDYEFSGREKTTQSPKLKQAYRGRKRNLKSFHLWRSGSSFTIKRYQAKVTTFDESQKTTRGLGTVRFDACVVTGGPVE